MLKTYDYERTPVVEIVNDILVDCSKRGASDIHFDPHEDLMLIRIRVDGNLVNYAEIPNDIKKNLITRIKIISGMNITESRLPQDGAIKTSLQGIDMDLRVSCLPTLEGEKIVIRILDYSMSEAGLETLGFSDENYKKIIKMISSPNGIILVTGATGTGKSTTVYSVLQRLNREETNIISVEDPIEMNIEGINQVQTNSEIGLTFANALRSILRQDPNIIMIGEIRDTETAKIAVRASITGHLVLSTIHTNNSLNTIERLLDMDVERYLLSSALTGIVSQKLARKLCTKCKKLRPTNDYEKDIFKKVLHKDINEVYAAEGCEECSNGYKGRISIHEVLLVNQEIKDAISSNMRKDKLRELVYKSDVTTLLQDGLEKVVNGQTTVEEILKIIELDNDDKAIEGEYDLKDALDLTSISQSATNSEENVENTDSTFNSTPETEIKNENIDNNVVENINNDQIENKENIEIQNPIVEEKENNTSNVNENNKENKEDSVAIDSTPNPTTEIKDDVKESESPNLESLNDFIESTFGDDQELSTPESNKGNDIKNDSENINTEPEIKEIPKEENEEKKEKKGFWKKLNKKDKDESSDDIDIQF